MLQQLSNGEFFYIGTGFRSFSEIPKNSHQGSNPVFLAMVMQNGKSPPPPPVANENYFNWYMKKSPLGDRLLSALSTNSKLNKIK